MKRTRPARGTFRRIFTAGFAACGPVAAAGVLVAAAGCGGGTPEAGETGGAVAVEAVRAEIERVTRRWEASLIAGAPGEAVADVFTPDAMRLPSGEPAVRGHEAIVRALAGSIPLSEARFTIEDIEVDGDLAFANGTYRVRGPDDVELDGKFLEVWKRLETGWRIHRVMWD
ncbi:nuclear transport factor 2 family protein [Candidatus Palauibacter polyketidifaciens]|uniref:YybH family protein n=1 Tax=Candidatus Palauibacter polyketidifaciens TaxID=3056740 RepID=UPI002382DE25|nr:nuclear transport factor 2 family protein [Candidatus Palauibacter polyketidifaciens]MDE2719320.1 nuclear transport factor 2 family protein [Candidatus Palauibacter polyketidifaciens]